MVVRQATGLALAGILIGALAAILLTRVMRGLLVDVTPGDPLTFAGVAALLALVALLAGYLPGRRATRVDAVIALRSE